jgi:hypothetical protein
MAKKTGIEIESAGTPPSSTAGAPAPASASAPATNETATPVMARFWSMKERHQIALPLGRNVIFKGHVFLTEDSGQIARAIRSARIHDIREVVDKPFEDESDQAKLNKFLNDIVYTGERGIASQRGVKLLMGLFSNSEISRLQDAHFQKTKSPLTPDVIIMRAIKTKSFKGGI